MARVGYEFRPSSEKQFWIPQNGIERDVITYEISRYLGLDALVRPAKNASGQNGYLITAFRAPTSQMIVSRKKSSKKYLQEKNSRRIQDRIEDPLELGREEIYNNYDVSMEDADEDVLDDPPLSMRPALPGFSQSEIETKYTYIRSVASAAEPPWPQMVPGDLLSRLGVSGTAVSESAETYQSLLPLDTNLQTRLRAVWCETHPFKLFNDAFLDTGATDNVISKKLYDVLFAMEAVELNDDDSNQSAIGSAVGEPLKVLGTTKVTVCWFDHLGDTQKRKIVFHVIPNLYPDMIFKATTIHQLDLRRSADTWPRDDPRRGLLMFSRPWVSAEKKKLDEKQHEIKKAQNAARAAEEHKERERNRNDNGRSNTPPQNDGSTPTRS